MPKRKIVLEGAVRIGAKHQVTTPHRISKALHLKKGDHMIVRLVGEREEKIPAGLIPNDQGWFWTPEWEAKEREVDDALARGKFKKASSVGEWLDEVKGKTAAPSRH